MSPATYDQDLYTWALEQAALLRAHKFDQIDLEHIIEEIEDMSKSEKRALASFLEDLLVHLLKWQYQPAYQGRGWKFTIIEQRKRIGHHLDENPGLKSKLPESTPVSDDFISYLIHKPVKMNEPFLSRAEANER